MKLTSTSYVVLGMLRLGRRNGYEIKQLVDRSVRFFWAASYGQIYPELSRLEEAGYVTAEDDPRGGRQRRSYTLTTAGEDALRDWTRATDAAHELRDEAMLKIFFADPEDGAAVAAAAAERHRRMVVTLEEVERELHPEARGPRTILSHGLDYHRWCADSFQRMHKELQED